MATSKPDVFQQHFPISCSAKNWPILPLLYQFKKLGFYLSYGTLQTAFREKNMPHKKSASKRKNTFDAMQKWNECWRFGKITDAFISKVGAHPPGTSLTKTECVQFNRLCVGVRHFPSCLHKWDIAPSAACECGVKWCVCGPVVFTHPQCGLQPRNLDILGSCWWRWHPQRYLI